MGYKMEYKDAIFTYSKILNYHVRGSVLLLLCGSFAVKYNLKYSLPYELFTHIKIVEFSGGISILATYGVSPPQDDTPKTEWTLNGAKIISTSEVMEELL